MPMWASDEDGSGMEESGWSTCFSLFFPSCVQRGREPLIAVKLHEQPGMGDSPSMPWTPRCREECSEVVLEWCS